MGQLQEPKGLKKMRIQDYVSRENLRFMGIGACKQVGEMLVENLKDKQIIYIAATPQGYSYNGFRKNIERAYIWNDKEKRVDLLFSNLSPHRASQAIKNYQKYLDGKIADWVWNNYVTNGYNTRRGLLADYSHKETRIKQIAKSHADYDMYATGDSTHDHKVRVALRN